MKKLHLLILLFVLSAIVIASCDKSINISFVVSGITITIPLDSTSQTGTFSASTPIPIPNSIDSALQSLGASLSDVQSITPQSCDSLTNQSTLSEFKLLQFSVAAANSSTSQNFINIDSSHIPTTTGYTKINLVGSPLVTPVTIPVSNLSGTLCQVGVKATNKSAIRYPSTLILHNIQIQVKGSHKILK